ncbi:MAG: hypothetical protein ACJAVI_001602 [Candidatus Azotimanducaceae bacterium]|jgi:hypothetical protein
MLFFASLVVCTSIVQAASIEAPVVPDVSVWASEESLGNPSSINLQREARVLPLLRGFEWRLDIESFRALPNNCWEDLIRIANDARFMKITRSRASVALTLFANDNVWLHMMSQLAADFPGSSENAVMRRRAVDQLCETFAVARSDAVAGKMIPLLEEVDPQLRVRAAQCLQLMATESGKKALLEYKTKLERSAAESDWELEALNF